MNPLNETEIRHKKNKKKKNRKMCLFTNPMHVLIEACFGSEVTKPNNNGAVLSRAEVNASRIIPNVLIQCIHYTFNTTAGHWNAAKRQLAAETYFL